MQSTDRSMHQWRPAGGGDRLSNLSDDLLIHILSFAPAREAASTTALSRRWRHRLWLESSAVNLDYRSYPTAGGDVRALRWRAESDAQNALAFHRSCSSDKPAAKRAAVVMRGDTMDDAVLRAATNSGTGDEEEEGDGVEEIFIDCTKDGAAPSLSSSCCYELSLNSLPHAALRTLDLKGCALVRRRRLAVSFPCLEALRLRRCVFHLDALQDMVDAAPRLADLRIESCTLQGSYVRLRCPPATVYFVLTELDMAEFSFFFLEAPGLRRVRYAQPQIAPAAAVFFLQDLELLQRAHLELRHPTPLTADNLRGLRHARALKLTVFSIADLLDDGPSTPLATFPNLERVEIEELTTCGSPASRAAAVVSLLRRSPMVRELRLKSRWRDYVCDTVPDPETRAAAMADFSPCRSVNRDEDDEAECCKKSLGKLPELNCSCACTALDSLRRVAMDFDADELSCFHVRLLRFLARNAVGLEGVAVAGGKGYDSSRIDRKISTWMKTRSTGCCAPLVSSSSPAPASRVRARAWAWPPPPHEFPLPEEALDDLTNSPWSGGGGKGLDYYLYLYDDDDDGRHSVRVSRKRNKVWCSPEWLTVKLPKKGRLAAAGSAPRWIMRGAGAGRRSLGEEEEVVGGGGEEGEVCGEGSAAATPAPEWPPGLSEFPPLVPALPPAETPADSPVLLPAPDTPSSPCSTSDGEGEWHLVRRRRSRRRLDVACQASRAY